jgi:hypothetical protein
MEAAEFARAGLFDIEAMSGPGNVVFGIKPLGAELASHKLDLNYGTGDRVAMHIYVFNYDALITGTPVSDSAAPAVSSDPRFPTPQEAILELEPEQVPLDLQQEMRFTPDHPDTDGDGVPDAVDHFPKDAKRS